MKLHGSLLVGAATHVGCVRHTNEDDYLVWVPDDGNLRSKRGRLIVVADGMGGVTGGCEASRTAVRALGTAYLDDASAPLDPAHRMRTGFEAACVRVFEESIETPRLRGMGTTMTALNFIDGRVVIGHVGDSRCYRYRQGSLETLTEDHAVRGEENRLTRCVGGGRDREEIDVDEHEARGGDVFLLATDGLWDVIGDDQIRFALRAEEPQQAAESLVRLAVDAGGPDNCTAVVVRVEVPAEGGAGEVDIPAEELRYAPALTTRTRSLRRPTWPWILLTIAAVVGLLVAAKHAYGFDVVAEISRWLGSL